MSSSAIIFGPVPSRRLGRSLGINNIPPKVCSYACVYCQVGRTLKHVVKPRTFFGPEEIKKQVAARIKALHRRGGKIDYLTFVPDGEPALDINLEKTIEMICPLGVKIAVISNGSLLWKPEIRQSLQKVDWVSVKVDAIDENIWRRINRPHKNLHLNKILAGIQKFSEEYRGQLVTETMLVKGLNDSVESVTEIVDFIAKISPYKSYVALPTRPPAEHGVTPPGGEAMILAYQIFKKKISNTELLIEYEGEDFATTGNIRDELLSITSVHPLREEAVDKLLKGANVGREVIDGLIKEKKITMTEYLGKRFYLRNFQQP